MSTTHQATTRHDPASRGGRSRRAGAPIGSIGPLGTIVPVWITVLVLLLALGCAGAGPRPRAGRAGRTDRAGQAGRPAEPSGRPGAASGQAGGEEYLEERGLLLLLVDRQTYEPLLVRRCLAGPPTLREDLTVALGRAGDHRGLDPLLGLLIDDQPEVRRAAAFALGELGERLGPSQIGERRRAAAGLLDAVAESDRQVGALAVEALGKLGVTVAQVTARMGDLSEEERWARLLPSLYRFPDPETPALALRALSQEDPPLDPELAAWAAYALTLQPGPGSLQPIRALAADPPSPRVAAWAARALGAIGTGARDLELLRPLLDETDPGPVIEALRAGAALVSAGSVAAPDDWRGRLAELVSDPRAGVRMTALDAAAAWLLDQRLGGLLADRVRSDAAPAERGAALVALASGGDPRAEELTAAAAGDRAPVLRARAAEAAGLLGAAAMLDRLANDPEPVVRQAVLAVRLAGREADSGSGAAGGAAGPLRWAQGALGVPSGGKGDPGDPDGGVRAVALGWLADNPQLPVQALEAPLERALGSRVIDERLEALAAITARARTVAEGSDEREAAVAMLLEVASGGDYTTRLRAADALESLGLARPAIGAAETGRSAQIYQGILVETRRPRTVEIRTERGDLQVRLACSRAPLTCVDFLRLADQGFYDGLSFHRMVPDSLVQGGDPRGDGWGGPGYNLRDEINRLRFGGEAGVLGMARTGRATAGSQFFLTLAPQPRLDGRFTALGEVVSGRDVLERILPGDRIESIREVTGAVQGR